MQRERVRHERRAIAIISLLVGAVVVLLVLANYKTNHNDQVLIESTTTTKTTAQSSRHNQQRRRLTLVRDPKSVVMKKPINSTQQKHQTSLPGKGKEKLKSNKTLNNQSAMTTTILNDREHVMQRQKDLPWHANVTVPYGLPHSAFEWCLPPHQPELEYNKCNASDLVNVLPLYGGLTNALKMILLGAILSLEENRCFFVDESKAHLHMRRNASHRMEDTFLNRYFTPIGLGINTEFIKSARRAGTISFREWQEVWNERNRRPGGQYYNISSLGYYNMEGHRLKRIIMRRLWRPLPHVRSKTCRGLAQHKGLDRDFIAMSVRRGDKGTEKFAFANTSQYIDEAEDVIATIFQNKIPTIFVATDDCRAVDEMRQLRPSWSFVSECDNAANMPGHDGFDLNDVSSWSQEQTDQHYFKFFVELFAMATAKVFIGVWYTNVTWWVYFMRLPNDHTFRILKTPGTQDMRLQFF